MIQTATRCPACLRAADLTLPACPHCGAGFPVMNRPHQLPTGTLLEERYEIGRSLGAGGFGITYLGWDKKLGMRVAIKEYYPVSLVERRAEDAWTVCARSTEDESAYAAGLARFKEEAQVLAKFADHPNIVNVRDYFDANGTVYIVMEYLEGVSLKELGEQQGLLTFDEAFSLLAPVMQALFAVHEQGVIHRDISPSNLMLLRNGNVKLLDFGTARSYNEAGEKSLSVVLKPGFAPPEQYSSHGRQGPWTDVYALCATIYKLITGITPENSMNRLFDDLLTPPSRLGAVISPEQETVLLQGMAVQAEERPQSMKELYERFRTAKGTAAASLPAEQTADDFDDEGVTVYRSSEKTEVKAAAGLKTGNKVQERAAHQKNTEKPVKRAAQDPIIKEERAPKTARKEKTAQSAGAGSKKGSFWSKKRNRIAVILGAAAVVAAAAVIVLLGGGSSSGRVKDTQISKFADTALTDDNIQAIAASPEITDLIFTNCTLTDAQLESIAKIDHLKQLTMNGCSGFTSLSPLAESSLTTLYYRSGVLDEKDYPTLDAAALFPVDFSFRVFDVSGWKIADEGSFLEHFPTAKQLYLRRLSGDLNLNNLSNMSTLSIIELSEVQIKDSDFSPLGGLSTLTQIDASRVGMTDLSWAEPLSHLFTLYIDGNELTNLDGLRDHAELNTLLVSNNALTDISALAGCTALTKLEANNNKISDISSLADCTNLLYLELQNNLIPDISALFGCVNLKRLNLQNNVITDLSPLVDCTAISKLYLDGNHVSNLDACRGMIDLTELYARDCSLSDISGLIDTTQLKTVDLRDNEITDVSPLRKNAPLLETLLLTNNRISDISSFSSLPKLNVISFCHNEVESISVLKNSASLRYLSAGDNKIKDISALSGLTLLQYIDLGDNRISDISDLPKFEKDQALLLLQNNEIKDISSLPFHPKYRCLALYGNPISDYAVIQDLVNANWLNDYLYVGYREGVSLDPVSLSPYSTHLTVVDAPADQKAGIKTRTKELKKEAGLGGNYYDVQFLSGEAADQKMDSLRNKALDYELTAGSGAGALSRILE